MQRDCGPAAVLAEGDVDGFLQARDALVVVGGAVDHEARRRRHLAELAAHPVVLAVRCTHAQAEGAAGPRVGLARMDREALRPEPVREVLGARPALEDPLARRVEDALQSDDVLVHWPRYAVS